MVLLPFDGLLYCTLRSIIELHVSLLMKTLFFSFFLVSILFQSHAQDSDIRRTYTWHFGHGSALDFSSGTPQYISGSEVYGNEGVASISDTCGNLLFYSNGDTLWNRNNQVMPNGLGLLGPDYYMSSTQSCLIVPQPGNDSIYFVFTNDEWENFGLNGFRYSVVDMTLDGGLGDVVSKNNLLYDTSLEKLGATYHQNNTDYWVVTRELDNSNVINDRYVSYLVSDQGVSNTPVYSYTGGKSGGTLGYLRFNSDGSAMATAMNASFAFYIDTIDIYDFDKSTGSVLPNPIKLTADTASVYGLCFSPDNSKLYASFYRWDLLGGAQYSKLVQYDLSSGNQTTIQNSMTTLAETSVGIYGAIQIRPDGKLFVARSHDLSGWNSDTLSVIHDPNLSGISCNFERNGFFLINGTAAGNIGLPNFVDSYLYHNWKPSCHVGIHELQSEPRKLIKVVDLMGKETEIKPNTLLIYIYNDGTTGKVFKVE